MSVRLTSVGTAAAVGEARSDNSTEDEVVCSVGGAAGGGGGRVASG